MYDELYELYRDLYLALGPTHGRLAHLRRRQRLGGVAREGLRV
jgi:hypothetical protein